MHLKKKYHLESGLYQRDEDPHDFSVTQVPMSPRKNSLSGGVRKSAVFVLLLVELGNGFNF